MWVRLGPPTCGTCPAHTTTTPVVTLPEPASYHYQAGAPRGGTWELGLLLSAPTDRRLLKQRRTSPKVARNRRTRPRRPPGASSRRPWSNNRCSSPSSLTGDMEHENGDAPARQYPLRTPWTHYLPAYMKFTPQSLIGGLPEPGCRRNSQAPNPPSEARL